MKSRIVSRGKQSNSGYHRTGKPNWWARVGDEFLKIEWTRGDKRLDCVVDLPPGTKVEIGCGKAGHGKKHDCIRESVVTEGITQPENTVEPV